VATGPLRAAGLYFPGLDSLRFFAALLVVLGHIPLNQQAVGLPSPHWGAVYYRGAPAVYFFFTLSGFLITLLLLREREVRGAIDIRAFYLRRILRIWPLYFLIAGFGLVFYRYLLPLAGIPYPVEYSLGLGVLLYVLFMPNVLNAMYSVGGILNPLWSIGIEEQFYLAWAPLVRWLRRVEVLCGLVLVVFLAIALANHEQLFGRGRVELFLGQLKFHFMAAGGLAACWFARREAADRAILPRWLRIWPVVLVLEYVLVARLPLSPAAGEMYQLALYVWLVLAVASRGENVGLLGWGPLVYLGRISYGIYMFHMIAVYATSQLFRTTQWLVATPLRFAVAYHLVAIGGTLLLAHLSFRFYEMPFLRLKHRFARVA
jgi:peptidoglycan/LPS O-acetylase OafA/YrhL